PAPTRPMAYPTARAASASPKYSKSSSAVGLRSASPLRGKFHRFHNVTVVPKPLQKPYPPFRIAATSADTYRAIGAMRLPIVVAVRLGTFEELGPSIAAYREAYQSAGHAGKGEVYLRVPIYVAETEASA